MKKVMLGVSLYPEQETLEEIDAYLKKASAYGFKKIFTSITINKKRISPL